MAMFENNKKLNIYFTVVNLVFFVLGIFFQSYLGRKNSFIIYSALFFSIIIIIVFDKNFSFKGLHEILDLREVLLLITFVTYRIAVYKYYEGTDLHETVMCILIPLMLYMFGKYIVLYTKENSYEKVRDITLAFGFGMTVFYFLGIFLYHYEDHIGIITDIRSWGTFLLPGQVATGGTIYSFYLTIIISLFLYAVCIFKENKIESIFLIFCGIIPTLWSVIVTKTRFSFVLFFIIIFVGILILLIDKLRKKESEFITEKIFKKKYILLIIIAFFIASVAISQTSTFRDWYKTTIWGRDGGFLFGNVRFKWAWNTIRDLVNYPFGNNHKTQNGYDTHMQWIDFAYCGGIIPFVTIIIFIILLFKDICLLTFSVYLDIKKKFLYILPFISLFLYAFSEKMRHQYYFFYFLLLFAGIIRGESILVKDNLKRVTEKCQ